MKKQAQVKIYFLVFTQFAEKAYIIDENIIKNEKYKFKFFETDSSGFIKTYIPKKPINNPESTLTFLKLSLKKMREIKKVKRGIVPIKVEATKLST